MTDRPTKTLLIGRGYWGSKLERYLRESPLFDLVKVMGKEGDTETDRALHRQDVEAVVIATPIDTHYNLARRALLAGKHVLVEKPLALTSGEAWDLVRLRQDEGKILMVDYVQTFAPSIVEALEYLPSIGPVRYVEAETSHLGRFGMGSNVYWLLASHWLAVVNEVRPLDALTWTQEKYLTGEDGLTTKGMIVGSDMAGAFCSVRVSLDTPGKVMTLTIYGELGVIQWDAQGDPVLSVVFHDRKPRALPAELGSLRLQGRFDERHNLRQALGSFRDCLQGRRQDNAAAAALVTQTIEEATKGTR